MRCKQALIPTCPDEGIRKQNKKWWRKICWSMAWCFADGLMISCLHKIHSNYVKSSDLIKPPRQEPRNSSKDTSSLTKFHPPCAWRSYKWKSLSQLEPQRSRGVLRHRRRWHWVRGRRSRRRRTFHRPHRSIPMCGNSALRAPFRWGTADSSDWPGESGRDVCKLQGDNWLEIVSPKSNHDSHSTKLELATWP